MKNLKFKNNCLDFFKKNKTKMCAMALAGVMTFSLTACGTKTDNKEAHQINETEILQSVKSNIEKNSDNITVTKDLENGCYVVTENSMLEIPFYEMDEKGNLVVAHTETQDMGTATYNITFEEAEELNLTELLESKLQKTK